MTANSLFNNPYSYVVEAPGDGVSDDTPYFQEYIDNLTGNANPMITSRTGKTALIIPPGTYNIKKDLIVRSTAGFRFVGVGSDIVTLKMSGSGFSQAGIFADGCLDCEFGGFTITGDGTETLTDAYRLDWTTAAQRSSSANKIRDLRIRNINANTYLSLEGTSGRQLDSTYLENIVLSGQQTAGSWVNTGTSQVGIAFGSGGGNNYNHRGIGVDAVGFYTGYKFTNSSAVIEGIQCGSNFTDFTFTGLAAQSTFTNIQSQNSGSFLTAVGFPPVSTSFNDVYFNTNFPNAGNVVVQIMSGQWNFNGFFGSLFSSGAFQAALFNLTGSATSRPSVVNLNLVSLNGTKTTCIIPTANRANVTVTNYSNYNPSTGFYTTAAGDVISAFTAAAWTNVV